MNIKELLEQEKVKDSFEEPTTIYQAKVNGWNAAIDYILEKYGDELSLRWVSLRDMEPEHQGKYPCVLEHQPDNWFAGWWSYKHGWLDDKLNDLDVTHWMPVLLPMPEPPEED